MIRKVSIFLICSVILGCGTTKKVAQTVSLPQWVQYKPVTTSYYVGIGSAIKTENIAEYQNTAKNNALADLASEISVTISTSSVLHQFESSLGYSEEFSSATKTSAKEQLEGYELVNSFESDTHYYIYYRLSKLKYAEIKEQRKSDAIQKGLDYFSKGEQKKSEHHYYEAISNYIKGLEAVKPYFTESLETTYKGSTIYLGNELFSGLMGIVNSIHINPVNKTVDVKKTEGLTTEDLTFYVETESKEKLVGIPITFNLGALPLRNSKVESDINGMVNYQLNEVKSKADEVYFIAKLDLNTIATGITFDPLFRKMIRKIDAPKGQIHIKISQPSFYISTMEKNLDQEMSPKILEPKIQQIMSLRRFPIVLKKDQADYSITIEANTSKVKKEGKMYYTKLSGNLKVYNSENQIILLKPFENIKGVQLSYNESGINAYKNLSDYLDRNLIIKLKEAVK